MKNLFSKPATILYPVVPVKFKPRTRGQVQIDIGSCIFCGICAKKCPTGAIEVLRDQKTWSIEKYDCIQCSSCVDQCPKKCLTMQNHYADACTKKVKEVVTNA